MTLSFKETITNKIIRRNILNKKLKIQMFQQISNKI